MPKPTDLLCIGIDGGATEVKAHAVVCEDLSRAQRFQLGEAQAARIYPRVAGFEPLPVTEQLAQREKPALSDLEREQGRLWVAAAADAVAEVVASSNASEAVVIGMGMPGLKTKNARGIAVINNGPRIPEFLPQLEALLATRGLHLFAPIQRLGSDADYCGIGEEWADGGAFRNVASAYYVGCGTGVADAMKLRGELVTFDVAKTWIQKSWQMVSARGATFEQLISAKNMNAAYRAHINATNGDAFPEIDALAGRAEAVTHLADVADALAELIVERLDTIKNGRRATPERGSVYATLTAQHAHRGTLLDRVVIGQRVGHIYSDERYANVFADVVDAALAQRILALGDAELAAHALVNDRIRPGFICASALRAAPALGAAIDAVRELRKTGFL